MQRSVAEQRAMLGLSRRTSSYSVCSCLAESKNEKEISRAVVVDRAAAAWEEVLCAREATQGICWCVMCRTRRRHRRDLRRKPQQGRARSMDRRRSSDQCGRWMMVETLTCVCLWLVFRHRTTPSMISPSVLRPIPSQLQSKTRS